MERYFRILDVGLTLSGPPEILDPIGVAYRRFEVDREPDTIAERLRLSTGDDESITIDERVVRLVPELDRGLQFHQNLQIALMDRIGSHAVLHAGAMVDGQGQAVVLAAPSGHGKSSMALELARRGFAFLGDDYAPLDLAEKTISPFPRAVGVIPREDTPIPEPFRTHALNPACARLSGKSLLDVGDVLGEQALADAPAPLRRVVLLTSRDGDPVAQSSTRVDLAVRIEDADELDRLFDATPGVEVLECGDQKHLRMWRLRLHHHLRPTEKLGDVFDGNRVVLFEKHWDPRPDFDRAPRIAPIKRREAAELLGREMLNRRRGSRLLAGYGGSIPRLFLDLAGALRDADCYRLEIGAFGETADLVHDLTSS